jgi:hypothetical protein
VIRLYRARYSTNVERVALTLALKGLDDPDDDELFHLILRDSQRDGRTRPRLAAWIEGMNALPRA